MNIDKIEEIIERAWAKFTDKENAKFIASAVVETALQKDERMNPIRGNYHDLASFKSNEMRTMKTTEVSQTLTLYDLQGNPAIAFLKSIFEDQSDKAKRNGVSNAAIRNTSGIHQLSTWVEPFAHVDLIASLRWNGGSYTTVPHGSRESFFGTNPIAYAVPTLDKPILCDMSTSEIPYLQLNFAKNNDLPLGPRQGMDAFGKETDDPAEVYNPKHNEDVRLLPMGGGYKGSSIMLLSEILTGAFVGAKMSREASDEPLIPEEFGGFLEVYDPSAISDVSSFKSSVSKMIDQIRRSQKAEGHATIRLPGDGAHQRAESRRIKNVLEVDEELVAAFSDM